ncbi:hypothetical protein [Saccharopolyspora pogona]|uniref:hypothetical protein n=1 Tax=Saccharopolyspora pogona TaxID=333966 RepID=UPI001CC25C69|nr:hypothetical protein [Saccharopolyspora pogona]
MGRTRRRRSAGWNFLQRYADRQAADDDGQIYGIRLHGELVGGILFRIFDVPTGPANSASGSRRRCRASA